MRRRPHARHIIHKMPTVAIYQIKKSVFVAATPTQGKYIVHTVDNAK